MASAWPPGREMQGSWDRMSREVMPTSPASPEWGTVGGQCAQESDPFLNLAWLGDSAPTKPPPALHSCRVGHGAPHPHPMSHGGPHCRQDRGLWALVSSTMLEKGRWILLQGKSWWVWEPRGSSASRSGTACVLGVSCPPRALTDTPPSGSQWQQYRRVLNWSQLGDLGKLLRSQKLNFLICKATHPWGSREN